MFTSNSYNIICIPKTYNNICINNSNSQLFQIKKGDLMSKLNDKVELQGNGCKYTEILLNLKDAHH